MCATLVLAPSGSGRPTRPVARGAAGAIPLAAVTGLGTGGADGPEIGEIVGAELASIVDAPCTCCTETRTQSRLPSPLGLLGLPAAGRTAAPSE